MKVHAFLLPLALVAHVGAHSQEILVAPADTTPSSSIAREYIQQRNFEAAVSVLEKASADGDSQAAAFLSRVLIGAPTPHQDKVRGCAIAGQVAEKRVPLAQMTLAECYLSKQLAAADRHLKIRENAISAYKAGLKPAGYLFFLSFVFDPEYTATGADGKPDARKLQALRDRPPADLQLLADSIHALGVAAETGFAPAAFTAGSYFLDASAPGNIDRALDYFGRLPPDYRLSSGAKRAVSSARYAKSVGAGSVSFKAFNNAMPMALVVASMFNSPEVCPVTSLKLDSVTPHSALAGANYLSIESGPMKDSYLVEGSWEEDWAFSGCSTKVVLRLKFTAHGLGGVSHKLGPLKSR